MYNHVLAGLSGWFFTYLSYLVMEVKMFLTTSNTTVHVCGSLVHRDDKESIKN